MFNSLTGPDDANLSLGRKLFLLNWGLVGLICAITGVGIGMLYSAGSGWEPWAWRQLVRFIPGFFLMFIVALIDVRFYLRVAYLAYAACLALLVVVEVRGRIGMGAQRWIDFGVFVLQPSELMKIALVLVLARYFHGLTVEQIRRPLVLVPPIVMVLVPVALVLLQPNLGTATLLLLASGAIFFSAGVRLWKFALVIGAGLAAIPVGWEFLHDYQRRRVHTFLDPESDPLGAGYNIIQSKIALGSGGLFGKGFTLGSQKRLNFLPEQQTDFIFSVVGEELGFVGVVVALSLFLALFLRSTRIAVRATDAFPSLVAFGLMSAWFVHVMVNVGMTLNLMPVTGIPLPFFSYGGSFLLVSWLAVAVLLRISAEGRGQADALGL